MVELAELIEKFETALPAHKASLHLTHNEHRDYYQSVEEWARDNGEGTGNCFFEWVSDAERAAAVAGDSVWMLHWYPDTPVGFNCIAASSLLALFRALSDKVQEKRS